MRAGTYATGDEFQTFPNLIRESGQGRHSVAKFARGCFATFHIAMQNIEIIIARQRSALRDAHVIDLEILAIT
jgi:hypothetical protein